MNQYILSKYNFFYETDDSVIGLNLYNQHLFSIQKNRYSLLKAYTLNIDNLRLEDPIFFSTMYKLGIIENRDINIPDILLMKNREEVFINDEFHLTINTTLNCNFSCWYCFESHQKSKMTTETKESIIIFIKNIIAEKKIRLLRLNWFGGEPLMTYKSVLIPLSEEINNLCRINNVALVTTITTNGYHIKPEIIDFFKKYNINTFQITLDGNKTDHDKIRYNKIGGSYDIIVKNIKEVITEVPNVKMFLRINYTQKNINHCTDIIESFPIELRKKIIINLVQVLQEKNYNVNTLKREINILSSFQNAGFNILPKTLLCHNYYSCYAELYNQLIINFDGRIFKCSACDFEKIEEEGILSKEGTVLWNDNLLAKRLSKATFDNKICISCKYLPICRGGCSQYSLLNNTKEGHKKCPIKAQYRFLIRQIMVNFSKTNSKLVNMRIMEQTII